VSVHLDEARVTRSGEFAGISLSIARWLPQGLRFCKEYFAGNHAADDDAAASSGGEHVSGLNTQMRRPRPARHSVPYQLAALADGYDVRTRFLARQYARPAAPDQYLESPCNGPEP
jgi:hypothetical protein